MSTSWTAISLPARPVIRPTTSPPCSRRLSDVAPVRHKGFDHTTQGAYAAAGVAKALDLPTRQVAHAIAISGTANNALRVTRTGTLSHWKGLAYAQTAMAATHAALLAGRGITGPAAVFEGYKGFNQQAVSAIIAATDPRLH